MAGVIAIIAVFAGLLAAAVAAVVALGVFAARTLLRSRSKSLQPRPPQPREMSASTEVIDVTATEVPTRPVER